jgi:glucose-6-phosphate 1-dehydrogenase
MSAVSLHTLTSKVQDQFCMEMRPSPGGFVIFGASGDLAERKLFPSLYHLRKTGMLPVHFYAIGMGRTAMTDDSFRDKVLASLKKFVPDFKEDAASKEFLASFYYHTSDYQDSKGYKALAERLKVLDKAHQAQGNRLFYLSIPPGLYVPVVRHLGEAGLNHENTDGWGWSRLIIEKPFGRDTATSNELTHEIRKYFRETQTYRIDHYLGKETVQSILVLRFANIMFEPIWNRTNVEQVQITVAESLGVGHRAGYYEEAGVLRDMFQNHLFQLFCITAMEAPASFMADRVRDEKSKVLRCVRPFDRAGLKESVVVGQYGPGPATGENLPGYLEEPGVAQNSRTETFAAMRLYVDNWRWQGVPFYLRSGKRLAKRVSEIAIQFKHVPHLLFEPLRPDDLAPNVLVLRIQPEEGISLSFQTKHPGPKLCMSQVTMDFNYESSFGEAPEAYERLFLDCMAGDQTLFNRSDWVDLSWQLLEPALDLGKKGAAPHSYPAGSWGPEAADALLAREKHFWRMP